MRGLGLALNLCLVAVVVDALVWAPPARAAKKRSRSTLSVAVATFEGRGSGGSEVKEALELELELVANAEVVSSDAIEKDLDASGGRATDPQVLAGLMRKRNIDVLVRGERGPGARSPDALIVAAYASDGKPHFVRELPLGSEPDVAAAAIGGSLKGALGAWKAQKVQRLPSGDEDGGRVRPEDVLVDDDKPSGRVVASPDDDILSDADPIGSDQRSRKEKEKEKAKEKEKQKQKEADKSLDFNQPDEPADAQANADTGSKRDRRSSADGDAGGTGTRRRSRLDDDAPATDRGSSAELDDEGRKVASAEVDDEVAAPEGDRRPGHTLAVMGGFQGATWRYSFNGLVKVGGDTVAVASDVSDPFHAGAGGRIDFWPIPWLGVDAEGGVSAMVFQFDPAQGARFSPDQFTVIQGGGAVMAKGRYVLTSGLPGLGVGGRVGYRFWGSSTETQTLQPGGAAITVVPGFTFHALALGVGVDLPLMIADRRFEAELRADALPATFYEEAPDNPGQSSLAFGWSVSLVARYELISAFFLEVGGRTTGASVNYEGAPKKPRQTLSKDNTPIPLAGGDVLNWTAGFDVGIGFMF